MADISVTVSPATVTTVEVTSLVAAPSVLYTGVQGPPGADGSSGNSFDQSLNTTDSPQFNKLALTQGINTCDGSINIGSYGSNGNFNGAYPYIECYDYTDAESAGMHLYSPSGGWLVQIANDSFAGLGAFAIYGLNDQGHVFAIDQSGNIRLGQNATVDPSGNLNISGTISGSNIGTAASLDVAVTGNAAPSEIVKGDDSRLTDNRYPTTHTQSLATIDPTGFTPTYGAAPIWTQGSGSVPDRWIMSSRVATLVNGLVPASQLPSYVDDVLEYATTNNFPATGEAGKIYVATTTNLTYRWSGSVYVEISPSTAQVQSDWNASSGLGAILNKPTLFSGSYTDLSNKPTLGTASSKDIPATGNASATQVVYGSDTRLSDSRTPSVHASSHASGGSDALTLAASQITGLATVATSGSYTDLINQAVIAKKSSADINSTNTTLADVTGLTNFVLEANTMYRFEFAGRHTCVSGGSQYLVLNSTQAIANASAQGWYVIFGSRTDAGFSNPSGNLYAFINRSSTGNTNNPSAAVYYIMTGSSAPTMKIQFSQTGTATGTATLLSGAVAVFTKLI